MGNVGKTAIITGGSKGLGRALAADLVRTGWDVIIDGRHGGEVRRTAAQIGAIPVGGDVTAPGHRRELIDAARRTGRLDVLVNNASALGPTPLPALRAYDLGDLRLVFETNVVAPLALVQLALPLLAEYEGAVVNVTSDAAVEAYEGWGGYGMSKAALEQLSNVLMVEEAVTRVWWFDPGDMRTDMHQRAFPGQDISDRPGPGTVAPLLRRLIEQRPPSGRVRASDLLQAPGAVSDRLSFTLPAKLRAAQPPEARGLGRDGVRMMVAHRSDGRLVDSTFGFFPSFLTPEDLVVINTSATLPAAVTGTDMVTGTEVVVHLSTWLGVAGGGSEIWAVEPRRPVGPTTKRWAGGPGVPAGSPPRLLRLDAEGAVLELLAPYRESPRLWRARITVKGPVLTWLSEHGRPVRYGYVARAWPLSAYQNVYANEPGSAEMPSAGRPFTSEMITRLVAAGVGVAPVVLHTGVASLEADELPYPERVRVTSATARRVNATKAAGGRVVAVGTTVVRALEVGFRCRQRPARGDGRLDRPGHIAGPWR